MTHDGVLEMLKLSSNVNQYKPLIRGNRLLEDAGMRLLAGRRYALLGVNGRGLHLSTFRLNVSTFCGIGGALRGCVGGD